MKKIILFLFFISSTLSSQHTVATDIAQEKVFVHFNSSLIITGENIYYKVYCLNKSNNQLSRLSKIAYLEIVNSDLKTVFKHKIKLEYGVGYGNIFIPTNIPSGNYKLIAYTQWMKNEGNLNTFKNDISIINPFQKNQDHIIAKNDSIYNKTSKIDYNLQYPLALKNSITNNKILHTVKSSFKPREAIKVEFHLTDKDLIHGNYSLSVSKIDSLAVPEVLKTINFDESYRITTTRYQNIFLPELRGEIISGKVINFQDQPISYANVSLSIPGKEYLVKIANTNKDGNFFFNIDEYYQHENAILQIIDSNRDSLKIIVDTNIAFKHPNYNFSKFRITKKDQEILLKRSVANQVENAYIDAKLNTVDSTELLVPFYKSKEVIYNLDDYTRFPTMTETIVEILPTVYVRHRKNGNTVHVRIYEDRIDSEVLPLLMIDGIVIQNHEEFLALSANAVSKVEVVNATYIYGNKIYEGIVALRTKTGNYKTYTDGDFIKKITLFKPQSLKNYFQPNYSKNQFERIPDYRYQLLWDPNLNLSDKNITFYASDIKGDFIMSLEGFTASGKPVSEVKIITIE